MRVSDQPDFLALSAIRYAIAICRRRSIQEYVCDLGKARDVERVLHPWSWLSGCSPEDLTLYL